MHEFRATTKNFSPAITELNAATRSGRLRHDGNPVLEWCLGNVVGRADRRGNLYPTKQRAEQKTDTTEKGTRTSMSLEAIHAKSVA